MTKDILHVYPNCSLGGMTTVYRNRALSDPENRYTFIFANDKAGSVAYQSLPNASIRIAGRDRFKAVVEYAVAQIEYDLVRITSLPQMPARLKKSTAEMVYEFHSSDESVIDQELAVLDRSLISKIVTPSEFLAERVRSRLPARERGLVEVLPNLVDESVFSPDGAVPDLQLGTGVTPLVWIGRLDKGKNALDFLRVLSLLPKSYVGVLILSYEDHPERMADMLGLAAALGVRERIRILLNLSQPQIAEIYRFASAHQGIFCSTSLGESYGYGVAEALASGLDSVAYDVGALAELSSCSAGYDLIAVGDLHGFAESISRRTTTAANR